MGKFRRKENYLFFFLSLKEECAKATHIENSAAASSVFFFFIKVWKLVFLVGKTFILKTLLLLKIIFFFRFSFSFLLTHSLTHFSQCWFSVLKECCKKERKKEEKNASARLELLIPALGFFSLVCVCDWEMRDLWLVKRIM